MILVDTNVLVYALNRTAPQHHESRSLVEAGMHGRLPLVLLPQVLIELFSVMTSVKRVASPLSAEDARQALDRIRRPLPVLPVTTHCLDELDALLAASPRVGPEVFDLFLIAQMKAHQVGDICTYNLGDFKSPGITARLPSQVLAAAGLP